MAQSSRPPDSTPDAGPLAEAWTDGLASLRGGPLQSRRLTGGEIDKLVEQLLTALRVRPSDEEE